MIKAQNSKPWELERIKQDMLWVMESIWNLVLEFSNLFEIWVLGYWNFLELWILKFRI
jgi:hypothetical protein